VVLQRTSALLCQCQRDTYVPETAFTSVLEHCSNIIKKKKHESSVIWFSSLNKNVFFLLKRVYKLL